ncbi:nuclear transport factor 2 family protein [Flavobacterium sp. ANB]|uniref:nuclear transport factor 2 family protein n=1 Tax=unclassified Flavobacterium TaxID=196869 RepID=UPI0012B7A260|nr:MULTISPECIES: nuclear transport factor 2 family protein [unclassified Flavobacterium]MBF4515624.1 nuclear transport factor 2 family protein [Flavobacterium sp. ANB]MTD68627.1 isomerase [Flavobacterium sp. LC2016-13]
MITSVEKMIEQYVSAWNENNLEAYKSEFKKCWATNAVYIDPYSEINGLDELAHFAYKSLEIMPTRKFSILEKPEFHHSFGKYVWEVEISGKTNIGYDYFEFNSNFEITRLISFFKLAEDYPLERLS